VFFACSWQPITQLPQPVQVPWCLPKRFGPGPWRFQRTASGGCTSSCAPERPSAVATLRMSNALGVCSSSSGGMGEISSQRATRS
jgi:hypothetical protein